MLKRMWRKREPLYAVGENVNSERVSHSVMLTLWDSMDCSLPGSSVRGILQARILKWVAIPFRRESSLPGDQTWIFHTVGRFFTI